MSTHSQLPEETDTHLRPAGVLHAIRYLGGIVTGRSAKRDAKLMEYLAVLLNDHLRLEGEVIRLSGIVQRSNKLEREKWTALYPFGTPKTAIDATALKPWDDYAEKYFTCEKCHCIQLYSTTEYKSRIVSVDGKPFCKGCLRKGQP